MYDNRGEPGGHYAQLNTRGTERQILCDLTYTWNLNMSNSYNQRVAWWLPGAVGWGKRGDVGEKAQTFSFKMNTF